MATNNEIVVTRAPRLKGVTWSIVPDYSFAADLSDGKVYSKIGTGLAVLAGKQAIGSNCHQMPSAVRWHPFEDFDAMCRWVVNGRKLEGLQSDGKDEWIPALNMDLGTYAEVVKPFGDLVKWDVVFRRNDNNYPILKVSTGFGYAGRTLGEESKLMVWPLGPGDSITISPRNP